MAEASPTPPPEPTVAPRSGPEVDVTQDFQASAAHASRLVEVLDQYLADLKAGQTPDRAKLLAAHPDLAEELGRYLDGMDFLHASGDATKPGKRLGDFHILREVGHGGMGAVYEAEQISLHRRVALKVLRFGRVSDPEALERFQREAETVACLHHTNIVPIFAIGSEGGVNYYAMQFIVGRSLDQVLKGQGGLIDAQKVAKWGLEAAEALSHSHARGVIHRDVKPSNLMLDEAEGRIWLTDFGLAKRLDDVTLSMTGALLGTPRYMSPEQASASTHKLDHRTDLYSLGATLYELATGKPVFVGDSPHNVISQILTVDPEPPRRHCPSLPRDLQTILLKCLAKDASQRYASAQELAKDLRAFLEGRPIAARRTSLFETGARWVKKQQRSLVLTTATVVTTLLLVLGMAAGSYFWQRSNLASFKLDTNHPPLIAELLDDANKPVLSRTTVPMQQEEEIPAGDYRLRIRSDERLSQEYDISLAAREVLGQKIDLEDQLLWGDLPFSRVYQTLRVADSGKAARTDLLLLNGDTIQRVDGRSKAVQWQTNLAQPEHDLLRKDFHLVWPWDRSAHTHGVGVFELRPFVVSTADLNGDGMGDLILAARHQAWVIAFSGKDGTPLWRAARDTAAGQDKRQQSAGIQSAVPYEPLLVPDQNEDDVDDVAAWFIRHSPKKKGAERSLELLSGKTGETLWKYEPPSEYFELPPNTDVPIAYRWYYGGSGGHSSGGHGSHFQGRNTRRTPSEVSRSGDAHYLPSTLRLSSKGVRFLAGMHGIDLDLASGTESTPTQDMAVRPSFEPRWADLEGDGKLDLLLTTTLPNKTAPTPGGIPTPQLQLTAWSPVKQSDLWHATIEAAPPIQEETYAEPPAWPVVEDLDGDGASEVIVPDGSTLSRPNWFGAPWGRIAVLEGRTGQTRWQRQIMNVDQQLNHFTVGPDIDGDGQREVYVASQWNEDLDLYVDCLSGKDGQSLWRQIEPTQEQKRSGGSHRIARLTWYSRGPAAGAELIVPLMADASNATNEVRMFAADNGRPTHLAPQVIEVEPGDFDGDGIDDLLLVRREHQHLPQQGGALHVCRGTAEELSRRLAAEEMVLADFDQDGVLDTAQRRRNGQIVARSGATGQRIWTSPSGLNLTLNLARAIEAQPSVVPAGEDLSGDGVPDLLLQHFVSSVSPEPALVALSGNNGKVLWRSAVASPNADMPALLESRDLDGDGEPEVILIAALDLNSRSRSGIFSNPPNLWLIVLSGRTGQTRFQQLLVERMRTGSSLRVDSLFLETSYADLNADGTLDLLVPAEVTPASKRLEMRALSGKDGQLLWRIDLPTTGNSDALRDAIPPALEDLDGDGRPEAVITAAFKSQSESSGSRDAVQLMILEGQSGKLRWQEEIPAESYYVQVQNMDRVATRIRPLLVRRGNERWIALLTRERGPVVRLFDSQGKLVGERRLTANSLAGRTDFRLWTCDVDHDGNDELVLCDDNRLCVVQADRLDQPLWKGGPAEGVNLVGVLTDDVFGPQLVLRGKSEDNSLSALSASSGQKLWSVVGPSGIASDHTATLLRAPSASAPPIARFAFNSLAIARQGLAFPGVEAPASWNRQPVLSNLSPPPPDPRLVRTLPWVPEEHELIGLPGFLLWSAFYGIVLVGIPVSFVISLVRRRRWGMRTMLMLPVVAGVFLMGVTIDGPDNDFRSLPHKLVIAGFFATPVMFALYQLGTWVGQRRWIPVVSWLAVGIIAVIVLGVAFWNADGNRGGPFEPGESYSLAGWYWILGPAYFAVAWWMTIAIPLGWTGRRLWIWLRRPKATVTA